VSPTADTFTMTNASTAANTSSTGLGSVRKITQQSISTGVTSSFAAGTLIATAVALAHSGAAALAQKVIFLRHGIGTSPWTVPSDCCPSIRSIALARAAARALATIMAPEAQPPEAPEPAQITNLSVTPGSTIAFQIGAGGAGGVNAVILDTTAWPHFSPARQPFRPSMDLVGAAAMELALLLELLAAPRPASDR